MYRHESPSSKENRPPSHSACHTASCATRRQPLGKHKACNIPRDAVTEADAWLKRSHAALTSKQQHGDRSPGRASAVAAPSNAPPAQPSASPDIIRKKCSREMPVAEGCFGIGPTVQGNVKDRRKSKPRALLTVEPVGEQTQGLPRPGRASLEWISDDADSELEADLTSTDGGGSSGDGSLCPGFARLQEWNALRGRSSNCVPSLIRKLEEVKLEFSCQDQPVVTVSSLCCSFREEARMVGEVSRPKSSEVRLAAFLKASRAVKGGHSSAVHGK